MVWMLARGSLDVKVMRRLLPKLGAAVRGQYWHYHYRHRRHLDRTVFSGRRTNRT